MRKESSLNKSVGIVSKPNKPEVAGVLPELTKWLRGRGYGFIVDPEAAPHASGAEVVSRKEMPARKLDFVIVFVGDGTLLSAARAVAKAGIPLLGVNLSPLGFFTDGPPHAL